MKEIDKVGKEMLLCFFSLSDLVLGTESSHTQLSWLRTFSDIGVEVLPSADEEEGKIRDAISIFEFEAKNIDGQLVQLEQYR